MSRPTAEAAATRRPSSLGSGQLGSALWALFGLTLRQHARGRRLLLMACLFCIPSAIALLAKYAGPEPAPAEGLEAALIFNLLPHALVPLAALLYSSGMIRDEVEEQTLTYLLVRPLPRRALYLTKLLATYLLVTALSAAFTWLTYVVIFADEPGGWSHMAEAVPLTLLAQALALAAYCSIFGCVSLYTNRTLIVGIAYVVLFEGVLANIEFAVRQLTVMFYFRVLSLRWVKPEETEWSIDLAAVPTASTCVMVLLGVGLVATLLALLAVKGKEFRMKTPEGG